MLLLHTYQFDVAQRPQVYSSERVAQKESSHKTVVDDLTVQLRAIRYVESDVFAQMSGIVHTALDPQYKHGARSSPEEAR